MDVERMISLLEENQEKATRCRTCLGMIPNEDNVEWMKNTILSRLHDMELNKVNCYLYWGYEIELCDDGMYIEAVYPKGYDYRKFEEIEGLKIDYDAMDKWERELE